ncbi:MAG: hypothetical protein PHW83_09600 [Bacteroidales bacterium]|nr:hypothetical protein [Bacteroidales bacterium]
MYADGTLVKGIPSVKDNFIENRFGGDYTLRFDGISVNVPKDGSTDLVLKVSLLSNPENQATNYRIAIPVNGIRGIDTANIDQYAVTAAQATANGTPENYSAHTFKSAVIDASTAAQKGQLTTSLNTNTPKLGFVTGNKTATTSNVELLKTDFKAENRDVTIKSLAVDMTDGGDLASAIKLYDGSTLLASVAGPGSAAATFTNLNILIAKDTTKTLTIKADIKPIDGVTITEGLTLTAAIQAVDTKITAVDSNDDMLATANMSNNTITGKKQTAYTKNPILTLATAEIAKTTQAGTADIADTTITFNVKANGGDIYVNKAD